LQKYMLFEGSGHFISDRYSRMGATYIFNLFEVLHLSSCLVWLVEGFAMGGNHVNDGDPGFVKGGYGVNDGDLGFVKCVDFSMGALHLCCWFLAELEAR